MKHYRKIVITLGSILAVIVISIASLVIYFSIYYKASLTADILISNKEVEVILNDDYISFVPQKDYNQALIFYQGAKVEEEAYAPMIKDLAEKGILCFIIRMPFNFALMNINAASDIIEEFSENDLQWYLAGHSLGGAMAANYASKNQQSLKGVILLSAYSTNNLEDLEVLTIYGDNDLVLNKEKYESCKNNLPTDFQEVIIAGGNHANFGYYGFQKNDGEATISKEEQIALTIEEIIKFMGRENA